MVICDDPPEIFGDLLPCIILRFGSEPMRQLVHMVDGGF
jgi:hypothetical protein